MKGKIGDADFFLLQPNALIRASFGLQEDRIQVGYVICDKAEANDVSAKCNDQHGNNYLLPPEL